MKALQPKLLLVAGTILVAALFRLVPHWPNFTPMAAIALMGGALFRSNGMRIAIPMLALLVSDYLTVTLINFKWVTPAEYFSSVQTAFVYLGFLSNIVVGMLMHRSLSNIQLGNAAYSAKLAGASLSTAVLFSLFPITGLGLAECPLAHRIWPKYTFLEFHFSDTTCWAMCSTALYSLDSSR